MKGILVGVDGSDDARHAADLASEIAQRFDARLQLADVVSPLAAGPQVDRAAAEESLRLAGLEILAAERQRLEKPGFAVSTQVLFGPHAETLADHAVTDGFDLVVVGSRGRGAVQRVLLGSVSSRLAHICRRPLLVVPRT